MENEIDMMEFQSRRQIRTGRVIEQEERDYEGIMASLPKILYLTSKPKEPNAIDRVVIGTRIMAGAIEKHKGAFKDVAAAFKDVEERNKRAMKAIGLGDD